MKQAKRTIMGDGQRGLLPNSGPCILNLSSCQNCSYRHSGWFSSDELATQKQWPVPAISLDRANGSGELDGLEPNRSSPRPSPYSVSAALGSTLDGALSGATALGSMLNGALIRSGTTALGSTASLSGSGSASSSRSASSLVRLLAL